MRNKKIASGILMLIAVNLCAFEAHAQKIKLHAPLKAVEIPLRRIVGDNNVYYDIATRTLTVSGVETVTREMVESYKGITKVVKIGKEVKNIGDLAFSNFTDLECVQQQYDDGCKCLENSLRVIGVGAFENCRNLEAIFLYNRYGVTILKNAFSDCPNLRWLNLNIKCMVSGAFVRCNRLKLSGIAGFESIFYIGQGAFAECGRIGYMRERVGCSSVEDICNPMIKNIDFVAGTITLEGNYFGFYDLLAYFLALKDHGWNTFTVIANDGAEIEGAVRTPDGLWKLHGCKFLMYTSAFYDYLCNLYEDTKTDSEFSSEHTSPETDSDYDYR